MELRDGEKVIAKITAAAPKVAGIEEGVWIEIQAADGTRPTLCLVKEQPGDYSRGWYLGVYRDSREPALSACDLAIQFDPAAGPTVQVRRGNDIKIVSLFDLLSKIG